MTFEEYKKQLEQEDKPLERPLIDPIDVAGGMAGAAAAKGLFGLGKAAVTEGAGMAEQALAKSGALNKLKGIISPAPMAEEATKTASMGSMAPLTGEELAAGAAPKASNSIHALTGKGEEYLLDQEGNPIAKFINGNMAEENVKTMPVAGGFPGLRKVMGQ